LISLDTNRFTWKGLSYDPDVGLTYVRSRWYDPNIGRFVSEDPLGLGGGINPYVFAGDDPVNGSDPTGLTAYISFNNDRCQYSYVRFDPDVHFEHGGCDFGGGSGSVTDFDPLATDRSWGHPDQPSQGDAPSGAATGPTSGKPTLQQVAAAVGREVAPFNNAMNHAMGCAERTGEFALGLTGDRSLWKAVKQVFSRLTITALVTRTLSMGETTATVSTVSVGSAVVVNTAAAREAGHIYAEGAAQTRGFNWIHGDNPLMSYVPIYGTWRYAAPAAWGACVHGTSE
jgi:RHS repeat-associated protein